MAMLISYIQLCLKLIPSEIMNIVLHFLHVLNQLKIYLFHKRSSIFLISYI
jgi:hypothetical protein